MIGTKYQWTIYSLIAVYVNLDCMHSTLIYTNICTYISHKSDIYGLPLSARRDNVNMLSLIFRCI